MALVASLLAVIAPMSDAASPRPRANFIVGYATSAGHDALVAAGVAPLREHAGLGLASVNVTETVASALRLNPNVAFVEPNKLAVFAAATGWDATSWDATGWDATGWDATGWDATGWDATGWDATGWDATGWDATGWDATGWDATGWDATGWDATGWDATGWDATGWDATGWDATGWDATGWDATGWDATGWDATGWDATGWDATGWDATGWDATGWDATGWDWRALTIEGATPSADGSDPLFDRQWGLQATNGPAARDAFAAMNAATKPICIVDSGVDYRHPDLAGAMWRHPTTGQYGYDFVNGDADPMDDGWHGTHVAGIAAARANNGVGIVGASPAPIMAVKVLSSAGTGYEADLAWGITWCVENGAGVVSMSLGTPENSRAIHRAVKDAYAKGVVLVSAIGNEGRCNCTRYPAAYPEVVAVGALAPTGSPAAFTTVSADVDIAAPGAAIVGPITTGRYAAANGTSQATPFVSATASMMLAANPSLTPAQVFAILTTSARDLGPAGRDDWTGYGALDAQAALAKAVAP